MAGQQLTQQEFVMRWMGAVRAAVNARVTEEGGNNRGAQIETYQRACGGEPGESWCLYMQTFYALKEMAREHMGAGQQITSENIVGLCRAQSQALTQAYHIPVTGSCGAACDFYERRGMLLRREEVRQIKPGWLVFYAFTRADIQNRVPRHVGMCDADWNRSALPIASLEGNTANSAGNPSDGEGCYRRERGFTNVVAVARTY